MKYVDHTFETFRYLPSARMCVAIVLSLSAIFELAWFTLQNVGFLGDSPSYIQYAWGLLGDPISSTTLGARTVGYPLLLVLTGAVGPGEHFNSFLGILLLQAVMAVAMPVLVYKTLEPFNRHAAFYTALVMIVSLQPYITSKLIMTEQSYKFFVLLLIYFFCEACRTRAPRRWIFCLVLTSVVLVAVRPAASLMFVVVFGSLLFIRPKDWKSVISGFAFVVALVFVYSFTVSLLLPPKALWMREPGKKIYDLAFYDLYMGPQSGGLDPSKGPARSALHDILESFAVERPQDWAGRSPKSAFADFADKPASWVENVYRQPSPFYYAALKDAVAMTQSLSPEETNRVKARQLIKRVVFEAYLDEPWRIASLLYRYGLASSGGFAGQLMYYKIFMVENLAVFSANNGPASAEFIDVLVHYFRDFPEELSRIAPPPKYKNYRGNVAGFIKDQIAGRPNPELLFSIWEIMDRTKGPIESRRLYTAVAREGINNGSALGPWGVYRELARSTLRNMKAFFFDIRNENFEYFHDRIEYYKGLPWAGELLSGMRPFSTIGGPPVDNGSDYVSWFDGFVKAIWNIVRLGSNVLVVIAAAFCIRTRYGWPVFVIGALILYHAAAACFFVGLQQRYIDQILPPTILLAGFVISSVLESWRRKFIHGKAIQKASGQ
jgi:hypothetical protein